MLRATRIAEEEGIPGIAVIAAGFMRQAKVTARAMGVPDISIVEYPGNIPLEGAEEFAHKVRNNVLPDVLDTITSKGSGKNDTGARTNEPGARDVVFTGSLQAVQDYFDDCGWSDGLPVVPPTRELVDAFLAWTDRDPDEVIGIMPPEFRKATVWSVAVNGVMAGCRPEYMPILLGIVEVLADPDFRIEDAGATPGWEPLIVVSGAIVDTLKFNTEAGNMRLGRRANASIGRFVRLYMRNVVGFRPGTTDKGSIGYNFNVAMGENEIAVNAIDWEPVRVDLGFGRDDNVVMIQSAVAISSPVYVGGDDPVTMIRPIVKYLEGTAGPFCFFGIARSRYHPLVQMSPSVATAFARHGWGKKEIRQYLFENCKYNARWVEHYPLHAMGQECTMAELVERGLASPLYAESDDPDRLLPMLLKPEWTNIVVAGDPARNQVKIYINNHRQAPPTARRIKLPPDWRKRLGQT